MRTDLAGDAASRLRGVGQRFTPKRRSLVELLARSGRPLSLPEILARGTGLAQSSVYRNLLVLEQAGIARRIVTANDYTRYELAEDLTEHHHHLVCSSCGAVQDLPASVRLERLVNETAAGVVAERGFTARGHRLDVVGLCSRCV